MINLKPLKSGLSILLAGLVSITTLQAQAEEISFAVPNWPGEEVKAEVASQILEKLGYETKQLNISWIIGLKSVANGDISVDMALWRPTQNSTLNPMLEKGDVKLLTTNVKDAQYNIVVPKYVYDAGVKSIADLAKHADKFENRIYGIEAGNDGNQIVIDAIESNQYGLKGFELLESSTAGMLSQAKLKIKKQEWIAFLGWKPHWMNVVYDIEYLDDPELIWGGGSTVNTVVAPDFIERQPNVTRFLKQMEIPSSVQSQWIYDYGYNEQPTSKVAKEWIANNPELLGQWLDGVTTADGKQEAIELF